MKKAKVMLVILSILAIIGIASAFKVQKTVRHVLYTGQLGSGSCTQKVNGAVIAPGIPNVAASVSPTTSGCPDVFTTTEVD